MLDRKIKYNTDVKAKYCPDFDTLKNFIGYKIYGANFIENFRDLGLCFHGSLADINNSDFPFVLRDYDGYENDLRYIVFEKDFQPTYRPYKTVNEIPFTVGDRIFVKTKEFNISRQSIYESFDYSYALVESFDFLHNRLYYINIGGRRMPLDMLHTAYLWKFNEKDNWQTFGVIDETR